MFTAKVKFVSKAELFPKADGRTQMQKVLKELQKIPGIGPACARDLYAIGIRKIPDLKDKNATHLYERLNAISGVKHDICILYTFRCAVYFASEKKHNRYKLNWWYWKDKK